MTPQAKSSPTPRTERHPSLWSSGNWSCVHSRRPFLSLPAVGFASFPDHGESGVDRCLPEDAKSLSPLTIPSLQICSMRID